LVKLSKELTVRVLPLSTERSAARAPAPMAARVASTETV
jgi:hypothetical protein